MFIFWMVAVGLVFGVAAAMLLDTRAFAAPVAFGIGGSCAAAWLGRGLGWIHGTTLSASLVLSVCGAVVALAVYAAVAHRLARSRR